MLRVHDVSKRYGRLPALDRVCLSVDPGEIVAVVGENGAGKSTLVRCIAGDVEPDEGRVDVPAPPGVVWQDLGLCDDLDVVANVFLGRERGRLLLAEARMQAEARRVLDRFGSALTDLRAPVAALSRGERQEVALARALATGSPLLVLDEPTASLSVLRRTEVVALLRALRAEGRAVLLVSHDLEEAFALADRIVVLRHGQVVATVSPSEVHADDVLALMSGIETESMVRRQLRYLLQQLSHELRTPLTAIHGYASTLQQPDLTWDAAATGRFLGAISAESERMERLVRDLLDSSAIESGLLRLRRDWTDLRLVLAAARDCIPEREQVSLDVAPGLEPVWADHDRLQQVFVNLLENAGRHGPARGTIEVLARPSAMDGTQVEVLVRDGGPGVPPELAEQIFEPRIRGGRGAGLGLGLAIARGIAEAHGGSCRLLPAPVTTFQVLLPVEPPDVREEASDG